MRIVPPIRPVRSGKILDTNLINHMIQRTEYGADLLAQYKMLAGTNMFVEQASGGLSVSYLTALAGGAGTGSGGAGTGSGGAGTGTGGAGTGSGGATQTIPFTGFVIPPDDLIPPINPPLLSCDQVVSWSINNLTFGPPYSPPKTGYIVSSAKWNISCLNNSARFPKSSFALDADDGGLFGSFVFPNVPGPGIPTVTQTGIITANASLYDNATFYLWVEWLVFDLWQGGFGLSGSGQFKLDPN
jgi:hypothetical protein